MRTRGKGFEEDGERRRESYLPNPVFLFEFFPTLLFLLRTLFFQPSFFFFPTYSWRAKKHTVLIFFGVCPPEAYGRRTRHPSAPRAVLLGWGKRAGVSPTLETPQHLRCFGLTWHIGYGGGLLSCARLPWPELAARFAIRFALGRGRGPERQTCISSAARGARRGGLSVRTMAAAHGQRPARAKAEGFLFLYISFCLTCFLTFFSLSFCFYLA